MNDKLPLMSKIGEVFLTWRRYLQRELNPDKITLKQLYVLRKLARKEFLYPSQIADILFCDRPTATVIINNMEREKWIRREKDSENAKQIKISLTKAGHEKLTILDKAKASKKETEFDPLECFSDEEIKEFNLLLNKLGKHLEKIEKK